MSDFLNLDAIFSAPDQVTEEVEVPEWGGKVQVQGITKAQQLAIRKEAVRGANVDETKMEGLLLVQGVVEPKIEKHHLGDLFKKSAGPVDRILKKVMDLSGMTDADLKVADEELKS